jgi:hypothetical protein
MRTLFGSTLLLALVLGSAEQAMGADPAGKFWPDLEAWAKSFDYGAMLGVIDPQ